MTLRELVMQLNEDCWKRELYDMPVYLADEDNRIVEIDTLGLSGKGLLLMPACEDLDEEEYEEEE